MSANCGKCNEDTEDTEAVECDTCLKWFHRSCTNLTKEKFAAIQTLGSDGHWYCAGCKDKASSSAVSSTRKKRIKNIGKKLIQNPYTKDFFTSGEEEIDEDEIKNEPKESKLFTCQYCSRTFQSNSGLWRHVHKKHIAKIKAAKGEGSLVKCEFCSKVDMTPASLKRHLAKEHKIVEEKTSKCKYCSKSFTFSSGLSRHVVTAHKKERIKKTLQCDVCKKMYGNNLSLKRHKKSIHKVMKPVVIHECKQCNKTFAKRIQLKTHRAEEHPQLKKHSRLKCVHDDCTLDFFNRTALVNHLINDHGVAINKVQKQFACWDDFISWKLNEEESTYTFFAKCSTDVLRRDGRQVFYYSCNRHGSSRAHVKTGEAQRLTNKKYVKGRVKTDSVCTASMKAELKEANVIVTYVNTHSHPISEGDIEFQPVPLPTWEKIKNMILIGKQPEEILQELQNGFGNLENRNENVTITKTNSIKRKAIISFKKRLGLSADKSRKRHGKEGIIRARLHSDDSLSTHMLIERLRKNENDPVILYKPLGRDITVGNNSMTNLSDFDNLFLLGLQSKEQLDMLKNNGNKILCMDAINANGNGYQLYNVMIKDEFDKGYTVASLIASHINEHVLYYFFAEIRNRHPDLNITLVMADDDMGGYACKWVFGENILTLLCPWRLKQAWKKNLPKESSTNSMYEHLVLIMDEKRQRTFHELWDKFKQKYAIYENFITYFTAECMNRMHVWSSAYRNFPHADSYTSMIFEAYNNRIKTQYIKKIPNKRIDDLTSICLRIERDDYCRHYWDFKKRHLECDQKTKIQEQHEKGMMIPDQNITQHSSNLWIVTSKDSHLIIYEVEMIKENCVDHCTNKCSNLSCHSLCSHLYHCTCSDEIHLCEHMHKIHSMLHQSIPLPAVTIPEATQENNQTVYTTTTVPSKETHEHNKMEKISQLRQVLNALSNLIESDDVYEAHYNNINENISDIVRQCRITESVDGNSALKSIKHGRSERSCKKRRRKPLLVPIVQKDPEPIAEVHDEITIEIEPDVQNYNQLNYTIHEEVTSSNEHEYATFFDNAPN